MKAALYERDGPPEVLEIRGVETTTPRDNEVLIKVRATMVTSADHRARTLDVPAGFGWASRPVFGVSKPRQPILGSELAGDVESVGKDASEFQVGDAVVGFTGASMGCHAEYRCMPEDGAVTLKPLSLTYYETAFAVRQIEGGLFSIQWSMFGVAAGLFAAAFFASAEAPLRPGWMSGLGWLSVIASAGTLAFGVVQAQTGYSDLSMAFQTGLYPGVLWILAVGVFLFRYPKPTGDIDEVTSGAGEQVGTGGHRTS